MKYIKKFENNIKPEFGYFEVKRGDLIKLYGKNNLYLVLEDGGGDQNSKIEIALIGNIITVFGNRITGMTLYYEPTFETEKLQYIRYRFLYDYEKPHLFTEMIENKYCVNLIKKNLNIDLTKIEGYKEFELENTMGKYNL